MQRPMRDISTLTLAHNAILHPEGGDEWLFTRDSPAAIL